MTLEGSDSKVIDLPCSLDPSRCTVIIINITIYQTARIICKITTNQSNVDNEASEFHCFK